MICIFPIVLQSSYNNSCACVFAASVTKISCKLKEQYMRG